MAEKDNFETLGNAYAKYPQSTLVMRKQYVDEKDATIADLQKIQDTEHPVFVPGSPFVSIEARSCVNTMPEIQKVDISNTQDFFSNRKKIGG